MLAQWHATGCVERAQRPWFASANLICEGRARNGLTLGVDYLRHQQGSKRGTRSFWGGCQVLSVESDGPESSKIAIRVPGDGTRSFFRLISPS
jgi:hypothetical protein